MFLNRLLLFAFALFLSLSPKAMSQEWAELLFPVKEYDFGTVPRDAKAEYRFEIYNPYEQDIHIASVSSSCSCSSPTVETPLLKTYETGSILVRFNSDKVQGPQKATLGVVIDKPFHGYVTLQVRGHVRNDISFQPRSAHFGDVPLGTEREKTVIVSYQGRKSTWKINEIRCTNPNITTEILAPKFLKGGTEVAIKIKLDKDAPVGHLSDRIFLVTNDAGSNEVPLMIEGEVRGAVSVKPATIYLGAISQGEEITRAIIVSGEKPFTIQKIQSTDKGLTVEPKSWDDPEPKTRFVIPLKLKTADVIESSSVSESVKISTDDPNATATLTIFAVVKPKEN